MSNMFIIQLLMNVYLITSFLRPSDTLQMTVHFLTLLPIKYPREFTLRRLILTVMMIGKFIVLYSVLCGMSLYDDYQSYKHQNQPDSDMNEVKEINASNAGPIQEDTHRSTLKSDEDPLVIHPIDLMINIPINGNHSKEDNPTESMINKAITEDATRDTIDNVTNADDIMPCHSTPTTEPSEPPSPLKAAVSQEALPLEDQNVPSSPFMYEASIISQHPSAEITLDDCLVNTPSMTPNNVSLSTASTRSTSSSKKTSDSFSIRLKETMQRLNSKSSTEQKIDSLPPFPPNDLANVKHMLPDPNYDAEKDPYKQQIRLMKSIDKRINGNKKESFPPSGPAILFSPGSEYASPINYSLLERSRHTSPADADASAMASTSTSPISHSATKSKVTSSTGVPTKSPLKKFLQTFGIKQKKKTGVASKKNSVKTPVKSTANSPEVTLKPKRTLSKRIKDSFKKPNQAVKSK
ncbi:hypothetical protein BDB01DRAFT_775057 [Pilobolus umbonatus]|nr:hypothetical protein BDB01DRAFT_775057 [Pilobolus umbonatus]